MPSTVNQPTESKPKVTRSRNPQIAHQKRPIEADAYFTITELTSVKSPYWICSPSTLFRALKNQTLVANYAGRKVLIRGAAVHNWLAGKGGNK